MPASKDWSDDAGGLRRFGLALVRDDRFIPDDISAGRLVDRLIRQSCMGAVKSVADRRLLGSHAAFARFIALHRRLVTKMAISELESRWGECAPSRGVAAAKAMRALPLELREPLLLVALAGFSHRDAARILDISMARFSERLERAHERFAALLGAEGEAPAPSQRSDAPHLRIIK